MMPAVLIEFDPDSSQMASIKILANTETEQIIVEAALQRLFNPPDRLKAMMKRALMWIVARRLAPIKIVQTVFNLLGLRAI